MELSDAANLFGYREVTARLDMLMKDMFAADEAGCKVFMNLKDRKQTLT